MFLDPPYRLIEEPRGRARVLAAVGALLAGPLAEGGTAVLHVPRDALRAGHFGPGCTARAREYGTSGLWYLEAGP